MDGVRRWSGSHSLSSIVRLFSCRDMSNSQPQRITGYLTIRCSASSLIRHTTTLFDNSYLSDFFYVWFRRTLVELYPHMLAEAATPKDAEIVVDRMHELSSSDRLMYYIISAS